MSPVAFRESVRARNTAIIKALEDAKLLRGASGEFTSLGAANFIPAANDPIWSGYDMTRQEFLDMLQAIDDFVTVFNNGTVAADALRSQKLYRGKIA